MAKGKQRHSRTESSASSPSVGSKGRAAAASSQRRSPSEGAATIPTNTSTLAPSDGGATTAPPTTTTTTSTTTSIAPPSQLPPLNFSSHRSWWNWCHAERQGIGWVLGCIIIGTFLGFGIGAGLLTGEFGGVGQKQWRVALAATIRSTSAYEIITLQKSPLEPFFDAWHFVSGTTTGQSSRSSSQDDASKNLKDDPSHPRIFALLREAIVREKGGYVHYDLGFLVPAPSGASRGLGMVRTTFTDCQKNCMPGISSEKKRTAKNATQTMTQPQKQSKQKFMQEEVLIRVPLSYQMTRTAALDVLLPLIPAEVLRKAPLNDLDDAAILVLFLAHERGVGRTSRWLPYIASLPLEPSCGYSKSLRPYMLDMMNALRDEVGLDVNGWPEEVLKATQYSDRIVKGLSRDYGLYLKTPDGISIADNIRWALCQVASRATGGSQKHGALRMIPVLDLINHDASAGSFVELTGKERIENGNFVDAKEKDSGTFVVRSLRHGRRKALRKGQELLANYNVPHYSPLDWLVSVGFVPPERWHPWEMVESALPRIRRDGPFAPNNDLSSSRVWQEESPSLLYSALHNDATL